MSKQWNATVMLVKTIYPALRQRALSKSCHHINDLLHILSAETTPCFPIAYEPASAHNTEETHCPLVLTNICQMSPGE